MILKIVVSPSPSGGYTVTVPRLPGCIAEGETHDEALAHIRDAIELYFEMDAELPIAVDAHIEELCI